MNAPQETAERPHFAPRRAECPAPISLETIAVVEQLLAQVVRDLRQKLAGSAAARDGAIEYASWLPQRRQASRPGS